PAVGCVIDGCPPGFALDLAAVQAQLARRRPGQSKLVTPRDEEDRIEALSGLDRESGRTLGTPIALLVRNSDQRSSSYAEWKHIYRPSHADFGYDAKYG
ncbi:MAG TPA: chorismate synthase, partial [Planctomycetes bacterium]|nr:chorismate synthase [Planctomycetota bacterium]